MIGIKCVALSQPETHFLSCQHAHATEIKQFLNFFAPSLSVSRNTRWNGTAHLYRLLALPLADLDYFNIKEAASLD